MDYADSESEVRFTPSRHSLMIFSVQNCKIAIVNFEKTLPYLNVIMDYCVNFRTTVYLCLNKNRNELKNVKLTIYYATNNKLSFSRSFALTVSEDNHLRMRHLITMNMTNSLHSICTKYLLSKIIYVESYYRNITQYINRSK